MDDFKNPWEITDKMLKNPWEVGGGNSVLDREETTSLSFLDEVNKKEANPFGNNLYIGFVPRNGHSMHKIAQIAQDILDNAGIRVQVRYFNMTQMDSTILDKIITRKYLADSDGLVFVGHGADIDAYLVPRIMLKDDVYPEHFFSNAEGKISGGDTSQADLKCKNNPNLSLKRTYYYSAYEIETYDNKKLSLNTQDIYLGRGVVHEWTHQIMLNNFKENTGEGHSSNTALLRVCLKIKFG